MRGAMATLLQVKSVPDVSHDLREGQLPIHQDSNTKDWGVRSDSQAFSETLLSIHPPLLVISEVPGK